jgi:hypothetical protein
LPDIENELGSKMLQLNRDGGATPFILRDLDCDVANSIPTALTEIESIAKRDFDVRLSTVPLA